MTEADKTARTRGLNDLLREEGIGGEVVLSTGVASLGGSQLKAIITALRAFDAFNPENDPHAEHDCATFTVGDEEFLWKIDYYDRSLTGHSPDPSDPVATRRVLTIMACSEY